MRTLDFIAQTLRPIRSRKLESVLIVLAIGFGVGIVTTLAGLYRFSFDVNNRAMQSLQVRELRIDQIDTSNFSSTEPLTEIGNKQPIPTTNGQMLDTIKTAVPEIRYAYIYEDKPWSRQAASVSETTVRFASLEFIQASGLQLRMGSWFSDKDLRNRANVVVISEEFAQEIFGSQNPVGQIITSTAKNKQPLRVIGIFQTPNTSQGFWRKAQPSGLIGLAPLQKDLASGTFVLSEFRFLPALNDVRNAQNALTTYIQNQWGSQVTVYSDFNLYETLQNRNIGLASVILGFTSLGLLIASLNVTNLMMARVKSRTQQMGIVSALGGSKRMIYLLSLGESVMLGILGAGVGFVIMLVLAQLFNGNASGTSVAARLHLGFFEMALCFGLATFMAVLFGLAPAAAAVRGSIAQAIRR